MRHKLLTIVAAVSLALSAATASLWIRSYWRVDIITFRWMENVDGGAASDAGKNADWVWR